MRLGEGAGLLSLMGGASMLVHLLFAIAFVFVGATTVRRASAQAGWLVVVSASVSGLSACANVVAHFASAQAAGDTEAFIYRSAMIGLVSLLFTLVSSGALLAALVQLANRPRGAGARGD